MGTWSKTGRSWAKLERHLSQILWPNVNPVRMNRIRIVVQFCSFWPSSFIAYNGSILTLLTVHLHFWTPLVLTHWTGQFSPLDRLLLFVETVHFFIPGPSIFTECPLRVFWIDRFDTWTSSSTLMGRPLWPKTFQFRLDPIKYFSSIRLLEKCRFNETRRKFKDPSTRPRTGRRGRSGPSEYSSFIDGVFYIVDDNGNERNNTDACHKPKKDFISN